MARFSVPKKIQQEVLMVGIIIALVLRGIFILVGAQLIENFSLDLLHLRRLPRLDRDPAAPRRRRRTTTRGQPHRPLLRRRVRAHRHFDGMKFRTTHRRRPALHAAARRADRHRHHRPAVRARLDPGDLRHHREPVHRLHRERLRPDGPAAAVLPARRSARAARLPEVRDRVHPRVHRREARPARAARERAAVPQRRRAHRVGAGDRHLGLADRDRRCDGAVDPGQRLRMRHDGVETKDDEPARTSD